MSKKFAKRLRIILILAVVAVVIIAAVRTLKIEPATPAEKPTSPAVSVSAKPTPTPATAEPTEEPTGEPDAATAKPASNKPKKQAKKPKEDSEKDAKDDAKDEASDANAANTKPAADSATTTKPGGTTPAAEPEKKLVCTYEIRCDTLLDTSKVENEAILPYIPSNGVVLAATQVEFKDGESVFDVLKRVTRENDIQMEFREDALYSGAYIEGINYLYEFDGGTLSGWMYKVNGQFPNYGCSKYLLKNGDKVVWMYTCDLGRDIGDNSVW